MSIVSFTNQKQGIQDLLAALPAPANVATDRSRNEDQGKESKPGFVELLRDSSKSQEPAKRAEPTDKVDAPSRSESQQDEQAGADKSDEVDQTAQASDTQEDSTQETSESSDAEQATDQAKADQGDSQGKESLDEAQVQAAANAAAAQLKVIDAVVTEQPKAQAQANANQQVDLGNVKQATSNEKTAEQNQANVSNLSLNAALPNQTQNANGQALQAGAAATAQPIMPQGDAAQTNSGDTQSDSKTTTTTSTANTATTSNSNAATTNAFTLPDQAGSEARLPVNPTATTPSADAARQVQVQSAMNAADNDSLNSARLTRGLANAVQQRGGAVTMRLTPPEMGTVRIQMQITGTSVSATFHAESASAQTLLTNQLAQLRSALESKGMSVERLTVQPLAATSSTNNANQSQNQSDTQQQGQNQQQSAGDGRSRGQYSGGSSGRQSSDQQQDAGSSRQAPRGFFDRLNDASESEAA